MEVGKVKVGWLKIALGWAVCFGLRLIPFRPANYEPIMGTVIPFSKTYGWLTGFIFSFASIAVFDLYKGFFGTWTWITAIVYGLVAVGSYFFLRNRNNSPINYLACAFVGTIVYDLATGLTIGPMLFGQTLNEAFVGQIPFTAMHLMGNGIFALTISPLLAKWVVENKAFDTDTIASKIFKQALASKKLWGIRSGKSLWRFLEVLIQSTLGTFGCLKRLRSWAIISWLF
jgi:uncharacterized membrane protein